MASRGYFGAYFGAYFGSFFGSVTQDAIPDPNGGTLVSNGKFQGLVAPKNILNGILVKRTG